MMQWKLLSFSKKVKGIKKIIVAEHSEGSLVGMVASQKVATDGFVSIWGAGNTIGGIGVLNQTKCTST